MPAFDCPGARHAAASNPVLPTEIFLKIFSYIRVSVETEPAECKHILSQLSLVCNFFYTALRPRLFSRLVLNNETNSHTAAFKFCQALICGDTDAWALGAHIRNCDISLHVYDNPSPEVVAVSGIMSRQPLRWAPNIESLLLSVSGIDGDLWRIIGGLSKLKSVEVLSMSFRGDIPAEEMDHIAGLRLSNLDIHRSQVFSLPRLLDTTSLSELGCDSDLLDILLAGGPISTLETLAIYDFPSMRCLVNILSKVPSVHKLTICPPATESFEVTPRDFAALLPRLRSLQCPLSFLPFLVPRRPLVSLYVVSEESAPPDIDTILGFHGSNITITKLTLPSTMSLTTGHFPRLRKLRLLPPQDDADRLTTPGPQANADLTTLIRNICDRWAVIPSVESLYIIIYPRFPLLDLAMQCALLSGCLSQKFPALRMFQLGYHARWERFAADETWRVLVPAWRQAHVLARFESGDPGVVDHDGYLQRLGARNHWRDEAPLQLQELDDPDSLG